MTSAPTAAWPLEATNFTDVGIPPRVIVGTVFTRPALTVKATLWPVESWLPVPLSPSYIVSVAT